MFKYGSRTFILISVLTKKLKILIPIKFEDKFEIEFQMKRSTSWNQTVKMGLCNLEIT